MSSDSLQPVLTTRPLVRIDCSKKTEYDSLYFATCNQFFCLQDCSTQIFQVEYQGQLRNTRILEFKPLISTSYHILHRLELKYFPQTLCWFKPAALHRIWFGTCCFVPMSYFTQRPMTDRKIEQSYWHSLGRQQLLANSIKISFHTKKSESIKILLTLELSQYRKSGSIFSSSEPVAAHSDCRRLGNSLCLCSPVRPAQAE